MMVDARSRSRSAAVMAAKSKCRAGGGAPARRCLAGRSAGSRAAWAVFPNIVVPIAVAVAEARAGKSVPAVPGSGTAEGADSAECAAFQAAMFDAHVRCNVEPEHARHGSGTVRIRPDGHA